METTTGMFTLKGTCMRQGMTRFGGVGAVVVSLALCAAPTVRGADFLWTGSGTNSWLQTGPNWQGGTAPPVNSAANKLIFAGTTRLDPENFNNLSPTTGRLTSVGGVEFAAGAGAFVIGGQPFTIAGDVVNKSGVMQTLANGGSISGTRTFDTGSGGITFSGANQTTSSTSAVITKIGSGELVIDKFAPALNGTINVNEGALRFASDAGSNARIVNGTGGTVTGFGTAASIVNQGLFTPGSGTTSSGFSAGSADFSATTSNVVLDLYNPTAFDNVTAANNLVYGGNVKFDFSNYSASELQVGDAWQMFNLPNPDDGGTTSGNFTSMSATVVTAGGTQVVTFTGPTQPGGLWVSSALPNFTALSFSQETGQLFVVVPEPSTVMFAGIGVAMAGWHTVKESRRRRRQEWCVIDE